jgi:hypothetical protein
MSRLDNAIWNNLLLCNLMPVIALAVLMGKAAVAQEPITFSVAPDPEIVYRYQTQRCDWRSIPDSPARAFRRDDGSLVLMAAHFRNRIFEGSSFNDLRPNCAVLSMGAESANPAEYDDRFWIQSLIPLGGGRIIGLASQEYSGLRHDGVCLKGNDKPACWYLAIVALEADERDFSFKLLPRDQRLIAGSNRRFDKSINAAGFLTATNTVFEGDYAYFIGWTEDAAEPGGRGNCLFRAPRSDLVNGWQMMSKGRFVPSPDPYTKEDKASGPAQCDRLGGPDMSSKVRSLVWLEPKRQWLAVWSTRWKGTGGVYYATSSNLRDWSSAALLAPFEPFWGTDETGTFYDYPSIIDHDSISPVFQTTGDSFFLYLTRLNWENKRATMDRDLVRFKVTVN